MKFYFRLELVPAQDTTNPPTRDKRTWYFPDKDDDTVSFCKDAIAFNYDSSSGYSTYTPILESESGGNYTAYQYYGNTSAFFQMNAESGFVQLFGADSDIEACCPTTSSNKAKRLYLSFIKYVGAKGVLAGGGSGGPVVFTDLTVDNLDVLQTADLPAETLIVPRNLNNIHPAGYPLTTTYGEFHLASETMNVTSGYGSGSGDAKEGDWITIAAAGRSGSSSNQSIRADALFQIISHQSGIQDELQFTATVKYGRVNTIDIHEDSSYSPSYRTFDAIRIAYNQASGSTSTNTSVGTYDGAMLQLRVGKCHPTSYSRIQIRMSNNNNYTGWDEYIHPAPVQGVLGAATSPNLTYLQENNDPLS